MKLSPSDFEGEEIGDFSSPFDTLTAVTKVAAVKYEQEKSIKQRDVGNENGTTEDDQDFSVKQRPMKHVVIDEDDAYWLGLGETEVTPSFMINQPVLDVSKDDQDFSVKQRLMKHVVIDEDDAYWLGLGETEVTPSFMINQPVLDVSKYDQDFSVKQRSMKHVVIDEDDAYWLGLGETEVTPSFMISQPVLDVSKGERLMMREGFSKNIFANPEGMTKEERLRREKLLKKPVQEESSTAMSSKKQRLMTGRFFNRVNVTCPLYIAKKQSCTPTLDDERKSFFENFPKRKRSCKSESNDEEAVKLKGQKGDKPTFLKRKGCSFDRETSEKEDAVKLKKEMPTAPDPPSDLPEEFQNLIKAMGGSDVKLVIQKPLYVTDVSRGHNRLSMPLSQIREEFLTDGEKAVLNTQIGKHWEEIEVRLIDPSLNKRTICLRKWIMKKSAENFSYCYVLVKTWNMVVSDNNLQSSNVVQLWSFRVGSELCFALVKCGRGGEGSCGSSGKSCGKGDSTCTRKEGENGDNSSKNGGEGASSSQRSEGQDGASSSKNIGEDSSACPEN